VTFTAPKRGLLLYPGAGYAGEVAVADIGIPLAMTEVDGALEVPGVTDVRPIFPWPHPEDHKGARGRVAIIAGSASYSGAAVLAVSGALRMGAGYVYAIVPEPMADVVRVSMPGAIVRAVPATHDGSMARVDAVMAAIADVDAVVIGPGLTTAPSVGEIVHAVLRDVEVPFVIDADALNVLGGDLASLDGCRAPMVITPHAGEAARLLGCSAAEVLADRPGAAARLAGERRVALLKGPRTLVAHAARMAVVLAGDAGLARAGSGDVLAGMMGTLLAQRVTFFDAAVLAAHLHGRAAEFGTARLTDTCFTAADITGFLPDAVREVRSG
jgi:NAD(P)H-hydrate epimerase